MPKNSWSKLQKERLNNNETRKRMSISAKNRCIKRKCNRCFTIYYKKALNAHNKLLCDTCRAEKKAKKLKS